jgi:hypothetical protein
VLDNDVVAGKSFLDLKTSAPNVKKPTATISPVASSSNVDIAGMFFENLPATVAAPSTKKNAAEQDVKLFDDKPIARSDALKEVAFEGPKGILPKSSPVKTVVETFQQAGEELGESVRKGN